MRKATFKAQSSFSDVPFDRDVSMQLMRINQSTDSKNRLNNDLMMNETLDNRTNPTVDMKSQFQIQMGADKFMTNDNIVTGGSEHSREYIEHSN